MVPWRTKTSTQSFYGSLDFIFLFFITLKKKKNVLLRTVHWKVLSAGNPKWFLNGITAKKKKYKKVPLFLGVFVEKSIIMHKLHKKLHKTHNVYFKYV